MEIAPAALADGQAVKKKDGVAMETLQSPPAETLLLFPSHFSL